MCVLQCENAFDICMTDRAGASADSACIEALFPAVPQSYQDHKMNVPTSLTLKMLSRHLPSDSVAQCTAQVGLYKSVGSGRELVPLTSGPKFLRVSTGQITAAVDGLTIDVLRPMDDT